MPVVLLLSFATSAFAWLFDQVVLLLVPIQIVIWLMGKPRRWIVLSLGAYLLIGYLTFRTHFAPTVAQDWVAARGGDLSGDGWGLASSLQELSRAWGVCVAPMLLFWYLLVRRLAQTGSTADSDQSVVVST